jgi:glycosyltransferase involved in cell wall biosynthesis
MKISVITVCKNKLDSVERTIKSVIEQTYKDIEFIVIDGLSDDGTIEVIKKYKKNISSFVSEKDSGIYSAMNKGVKIATGDIFYFLNAGDAFYDNSICEKVVSFFSKEVKSDIVYGNIFFYDYINACGYNQIYGKINLSYFFYTCFVQQAMFFRKKCFQKVGYFNENFKISGDYDWIVRALKLNKLKMFYLDDFFCKFEGGGISNSNEHNQLHLEENNKIKLYFSKKDRFFIKKLKIKYFGFFKEKINRINEEKRRPIYNFFFNNLFLRITGWKID